MCHVAIAVSVLVQNLCLVLPKAAACLKAFIVCKIRDLHAFACHKKKNEETKLANVERNNAMCLHVYVRRETSVRLPIRNVVGPLCYTIPALAFFTPHSATKCSKAKNLLKAEYDFKLKILSYTFCIYCMTPAIKSNTS